MTVDRRAAGSAYSMHNSNGTANISPSHVPCETATLSTPTGMRGTACRTCHTQDPLDVLGYCPDCGHFAPTISPRTAPPDGDGGNEAARPAASSTQHLNKGRRRIAPPDGLTTPGGTPDAATSE